MDAARHSYRGKQMVVVYDLANNTRRPIVTSTIPGDNGGSSYESVSWSRDEQWLGLQTWTPNGDRRSLWVLRADGTGLRMLVDDARSAVWLHR